MIKQKGNFMEALLNDAAQRALRYLDDLDERSVAPLPEDVSRLAQLGGPLPDGPSDPAATLALLDEIGSPATVASVGRRYFGFVVGGSLPAALAANWLVSAWDQVAGLTIMSPVAAAVEQMTLPWLLELLGLPSTSGGAFVTGATMANFTGLIAARHALLERAGWDVEAQGLFGAPSVNVVVGNEVHVSLLKALGLAGFGRERVIRVPVDGQGRMRADALATVLPRLSGPTLLCIQAGNVNTGAFDPAQKLCAIAHEAGAWVHVDGAFGLWAAAAPTRAHLTDGYGEADSWAVDAHKWLNVPYDNGLAFVRDRRALQASMTITAAYLMQGETREPYHYTPEMSRRARGVEIWAALRTLGRAGLAELIERNCQLAARFAQGFGEAGFQVLNEVVLNQVLVSFGDAATTQRVVAAVQADGTCWCGSSVWQGQSAMRVSVSSWATTEEDVERSLAAIIHVANKVIHSTQR
jgi:glutamate/tyrosine decarboxylase-like PLP-dependent enzyme